MDAIIDLIPPKIAAHIPGLDSSAYVYAVGADLLDPSKRSFWLSVASIIFNPLYWNITARNGMLANELWEEANGQSTGTRRSTRSSAGRRAQPTSSS